MLISCIFVLQAACVPVSTTANLQFLEHPLVDKIWDVKQQVFIDKTTLSTLTHKSKYMLLGERHDNLVHHQHQTWFVEQLAKKTHLVSVAFEMIDNNQGARIAKQQIRSADELITELNRSKNNWNYKHRYRSLFSTVIDAGYKINSANLSSQQLMHTVRQGEENLPSAYRHMLDKSPLTVEQNKALVKEIKSSHCDMLGDKAASMMALAQRIRDAIMAHSLLKSRAPQKILIAGNGHVRNDRGVAVYLQSNLQEQTKQSDILSIGLVEVEGDIIAPADYAESWGSEHLPFDYVWFTPQVKRDDPCVDLKKHFNKNDDRG